MSIIIPDQNLKIYNYLFPTEKSVFELQKISFLTTIDLTERFSRFPIYKNMRASIMKTTDSRKKKLLESLRGGLIVSCQTQPGDPIHSEEMPVKMALAAEWAGAVGIRANSPEQISSIRAEVKLPIIGLWKITHEGTDVYITPTLDAARAIWEAGAEIIAMDCTDRTTHQNTKAYELLPIIKKEIPEAILFADVSTYDEAKRAISLGADIVAPTLHGYTESTKHNEIPDMRQFARMCRDFGNDAYVIMEGHINTPEDAMKCISLAAHAVVVGSAITRPHLIAKCFVDVLSNRGQGIVDNGQWIDNRGKNEENT